MSRGETFDRWIRGPFVEMNTELEGLYFDREDRHAIDSVGDSIKQTIMAEGHALITALLRGGVADTVGNPDGALWMLGNVGMYMSAMRRHEIHGALDRQAFADASVLAIRLGMRLGMAPRLCSCHLTIRNQSVAGQPWRFTTLPDEALFMQQNTRGVLLLQTAADALMRALSLGASNPASDEMFTVAKNAIWDVTRGNEQLFARLDIDRFFYSVRPYFQSMRVGNRDYRGLNAGDFCGINQIDLILGLCRVEDPGYAAVLAEKMPYMPPEDQMQLRRTMSMPNLIDQLLDLAPDHADRPWFQSGVRGLLDVCDAFAAYAAQHHDALIQRFIQDPARALSPDKLQIVTMSGPPLEVMLDWLKRLRDLRCAEGDAEIETRCHDLEYLRRSIAPDAPATTAALHRSRPALTLAQA
jgi:hypothetical protein